MICPMKGGYLRASAGAEASSFDFSLDEEAGKTTLRKTTNIYNSDDLQMDRAKFSSSLRPVRLVFSMAVDCITS